MGNAFVAFLCCHAFEFMDFDKQDRRAARKMKNVLDKNTGETCIDCHKGIAHKLPQGYDDDEEDEDD